MLVFQTVWKVTKVKRCLYTLLFRPLLAYFYAMKSSYLCLLDSWFRCLTTGQSWIKGWKELVIFCTARCHFRLRVPSYALVLKNDICLISREKLAKVHGTLSSNNSSEIVQLRTRLKFLDFKSWLWLQCYCFPSKLS